MGWETITYSCGHEDREQMYGPKAGRRARVEAAAARLCQPCWKASQADKPAKPVKMAYTRIGRRITVRATGGTFERKDDLKAAGFSWDGYEKEWSRELVAAGNPGDQEWIMSIQSIIDWIEQIKQLGLGAILDAYGRSLEDLCREASEDQADAAERLRVNVPGLEDLRAVNGAEELNRVAAAYPRADCYLRAEQAAQATNADRVAAGKRVMKELAAGGDLDAAQHLLAQLA